MGEEHREPGRGAYLGEVVGLLRGSHEDIGVLGKIEPEGRGTRLRGADKKQVRPRGRPSRSRGGAIAAGQDGTRLCDAFGFTARFGHRSMVDRRTLVDARLAAWLTADLLGKQRSRREGQGW